MNKIQRRSFGLILFLFMAILTIFSNTMPVSALSYGPGDVIAAVNSLRAEYGLPAYVTSQELNVICQEQADYMASINTLTHDREDGSSIPTTAENIAYGPVNNAMDSWVDDQPHFDTLISWSKAQVGAGVAEAGGYVYICLNITRYSDTEFNQIPFTQGPEVNDVPTLEPTEAPFVEGNDPTPDSDETVKVETEDASGKVEEETPVAMLNIVIEEEEQTDEVEPTSEPVEEVIPGAISEVQPQQIAIESRTGKMIAYALMGVGVLGLGGSIYGMIYALKVMSSKRATASTNGRKPRKEKSSRKKRGKDTSGSQEIPNEAEEE